MNLGTAFSFEITRYAIFGKSLYSAIFGADRIRKGHPSVSGGYDGPSVSQWLGDYDTVTYL